MSNVFYIQWLGGLIERGNLLLRSLQQGLSLSHNLSLGGRSWNTLTKLCQLLTTYLPTFGWHWWREFSTVIREIPRWHLLFNLFNIFFAKRQQILGLRNDSSINVHSNNSKKWHHEPWILSRNSEVNVIKERPLAQGSADYYLLCAKMQIMSSII